MELLDWFLSSLFGSLVMIIGKLDFVLKCLKNCEERTIGKTNKNILFLKIGCFYLVQVLNLKFLGRVVDLVGTWFRRNKKNRVA